MDLESVSVSQIISRDVKVLDQEQNIFDTSKVMIDNNIGHVIIIKNNDGENLVGIITERDIIRILSTFSLVGLQVIVRKLVNYHLIILSQIHQFWI